MGILDDLAMGLGLKERTQDYDARTARNIAEKQAFGDDKFAAMRSRQGYVSTGPGGRDYAAEYRAALSNPRGQAQNFLQRQGGQGYSPAIIRDDDRPFYQRAMFSPQSDQMSPQRYGVGPVKLSGPLRIPSILGMITGGLLNQRAREIPTVSASNGAMRVRPSGYEPPYSTTPYEIGNSGAGMDYVTPGYTANYQAPYEIGNSGMGMDYVTPTRLTSVLDSEPESLIPTPPSEDGLPELMLPGVDDPTYEEFMDYQREFEQEMGFNPVSEAEYRTMYNRMLSK